MAESESESDRKARRAAVDALLRKQDWGRIHTELLDFALRRGKSQALAEDLAQEAIRRVLDASWEPWDPEKNPSLLRFLMSIVNRELSNGRTGSRAHRELAMDSKAEEGSRARRVAKRAERVPVAESSTEARVLAADLLARRLQRLRADVERDPAVRALLAQKEEEGPETKEEQALATRFSVDEIREARRRLARHVARVRRELPGDAEADAEQAEDDRDEAASAPGRTAPARLASQASQAPRASRASRESKKP